MANLLGSTDPVGTPDDQKQTPPPPQPAAQTAAPTPPAGYKVDPKPPAGYKVDQPANTPDWVEPIQDTTDEGEPGWIKDAIGQVHAVPAADPPGNRTVAYVWPDDDKSTSQLNVVRADQFSPSVAAHETTHNYQNSRNIYFQKNLKELDAQEHMDTDPNNMEKYEYGGNAGLRDPHKSIGNYTREQQAAIVQKLSSAQASLHPHMSKAELQQWDDTKQAHERTIEQLKRIPAAETTTTSKIDDWLDKKTTLGRPLSHLENMIHPDKIDTRPMPVPEAPSVALGRANPSKYVRGGDYVLSTPEK